MVKISRQQIGACVRVQFLGGTSISRRVAEVYEDFTPNVKIDSIDECFLGFGGLRTAIGMREKCDGRS